MNTADLSRRTAAALIVSLLAACGGSDGNGDATAPTAPGAPAPAPAPAPDPTAPTPAPAPAPAPANVTGQYRQESAATSVDAALAAMNAQGAQGYAFLSTFVADAGGSAQAFGDFYLQDTAHGASRLQYVAIAQPATADAVLALLNQQGAGGFAYKAPLSFGSASGIRGLFVKDTSKSLTYTYERQPMSSALSRDGFVAQLNAQGARGFRLVGPLAAGNEFFNLYVKDSSADTYAYVGLDGLPSSPSTYGDTLRQRLDEQGGQGRLWIGDFVVAGGASASIFEKSASQSGAIRYSVEPSSGQQSLAQLQSQLNARAAQGLFYYSDVGVTDLGTSQSARFTVSVGGALTMRNPLAGITYP
ncbi:hypothetical protein [Acidovorax sp. NCPPB 3576]|uniref:hypothetical protein n=1 Tax=Acidovorax sp. NCPPB 3576 TaxID=2940488 RepID=UPI00234B220F|nr:hypothetical protein [Acidovorax sp. NCPPB 3576]WCM89024.1 hypothetical protein M5C98_02945 [Acidovorax sp. NCPPB 3576]